MCTTLDNLSGHYALKIKHLREFRVPPDTLRHAPHLGTDCLIVAQERITDFPVNG